MAGTFTPNAGTDFLVAGNVRFAAGVLTCTDGAAQAVATGFNQIYHVQATPASATTHGYIMGFTFTSTSNITAPTITSGDDFYVAIWGR